MNSRKKILFIITKSNLGGTQRYVLELATLLPKDRFEVLVAFGGHGLLETKLTEAGIRTYQIRSFERDINFVKEVQSLRELYTLMQTERPDVVHLNSSKAGGSGAFIARLCGIPKIVFTAHGWPFYEPRNIVWRSLVWFFSYLTTLLAHQVIVVSKHDQNGAQMPGLSRKIVYIPTALATIPSLSRSEARTYLAEFTHTDITDDTLLIGSVGEHVKNKNLLVAIQAVENVLKHTDQKICYFLIGSDGDERLALEHYIQEHGLAENVFLTGFIDNARNYLKAFDLFLMPSLKEGLPYGLLEAGATGLPVIASNVGGIPEVITNRQSGLLVDPYDISALTNAIRELVASPVKRAAFGDALHKKVSESYQLNSLLDETEALYTDTTPQ